MIAGKTGSGKSSLLHTLICNLALHYSPDEVQFYLVDFKKGVEFKTYASHELPHARIIGIESDREFGISVLERLDRILSERGEKFRTVNAQDVKSYRKARPDEHMPRMLLIVDEFQEFFVEDDQLSAAANLLLDRLVRQGRAFGIHVLLGSQTLGGAYSLARSTLGQVAVRIALQCSESDAHLILSEENSAARLLTRPGEAIYNDSNGLLEGNHPFQIAWLPDDRRDDFFAQIQDITRAKGLVPAADNRLRGECLLGSAKQRGAGQNDRSLRRNGQCRERTSSRGALVVAGRARVDQAADADSIQPPARRQHDDRGSRSGIRTGHPVRRPDYAGGAAERSSMHRLRRPSSMFSTAMRSM